MGCSFSKPTVAPEPSPLVAIPQIVPQNQPPADNVSTGLHVKSNAVVPLETLTKDNVSTPIKSLANGKSNAVYPSGIESAPTKKFPSDRSKESDVDGGDHLKDTTGLLFRDAVSNNKNIHAAVKRGDIEAVRSILHDGGDVNSIGMWNSTPLITAVQYGKNDIVLLLLDQTGVDVNHVNEKGASALLFACCEGQTEIVSLLLDRGARASPPPVQSFYNSQTDRSSPATPLSVACVNGHHEIVSLLLKGGCDVNASFNFPLGKSIHPKRNNTNTAGPAPAAGTGGLGVLGLTPLLVACLYNRDSVVRELLTFGPPRCDILYKDPENSTALHHAVKSGKAAATVVAELRKHLSTEQCAALINSVDDKGDSALHLAVRLRLDAVVKLLLNEWSADPMQKDGSGMNSIEAAAKIKGVAATAILKMLREFVANSTAAGDDGQNVVANSTAAGDDGQDEIDAHNGTNAAAGGDDKKKKDGKDGSRTSSITVAAGHISESKAIPAVIRGDDKKEKDAPIADLLGSPDVEEKTSGTTIATCISIGTEAKGAEAVPLNHDTAIDRDHEKAEGKSEQESTQGTNFKNKQNKDEFSPVRKSANERSSPSSSSSSSSSPMDHSNTMTTAVTADLQTAATTADEKNSDGSEPSNRDKQADEKHKDDKQADEKCSTVTSRGDKENPTLDPKREDKENPTLSPERREKSTAPSRVEEKENPTLSPERREKSTVPSRGEDKENPVLTPKQSVSNITASADKATLTKSMDSDRHGEHAKPGHRHHDHKDKQPADDQHRRDAGKSEEKKGATATAVTAVSPAATDSKMQLESTPTSPAASMDSVSSPTGKSKTAAATRERDANGVKLRPVRNASKPAAVIEYATSMGTPKGTIKSRGGTPKGALNAAAVSTDYSTPKGSKRSPDSHNKNGKEDCGRAGQLVDRK